MGDETDAMGNDTNQKGRTAWPPDGVSPGSGATGELEALLCPWEHERVRPPRRRPLLPPVSASSVAPGSSGGTAREPAPNGSGFRFTDAPPQRVRQALDVIDACGHTTGAEALTLPADLPLPHSCLVELAETHWGRLGGQVSYAPERIRIDRIAVPVTKAAAVYQAIRASWPDALPAAQLHAWASWMAPEPLAEVPGDQFDRLDLARAAIVTWWWADPHLT
jgi:hypothetical protein